MDEPSAKHFEWDLTDLIDSKDNDYLCFGGAVEDVSVLLGEFRRQYCTGWLKPLSDSDLLVKVLKDAENLIGRAYTLQLVVQLAAVAKGQETQTLKLLGQQAAALYNATLAAVEEPLIHIARTVEATNIPDLRPYADFLRHIQDFNKSGHESSGSNLNQCNASPENEHLTG